MASIKDLILSIESADSSFDEKLAAINKMEETLVAMRQQEEQAVQDNVDLIVEAIKLMEKKVTDQLEIAKSIVPEKGDKGDKGDRGADGKAGRDGLDGRDGKDGRDGVDGADGVSVTDAKIDFDGSLVITLSTGREINVGEVVAPDLAEKIKVITTMSTNGAVVIQDEGTTVSGGVKSINFVGATVTATNSGDDVTVSVAGSVYNPSNVAITGGSINGTTIGATTPAAGTFTEINTQTNSGTSTVTKGTSITGWLYSGTSFSVGGQETAPTGLFFSPDGLKMYVNGSTGDDVNEYTLGTAWDITTATFVTVFSTAAQDTGPQDLFFKPDGLTMFVLGGTNDTVYQYTLSTPWSVATASYASKSFSVTSQETLPLGLWFKPDGTTMYVVGSTNDTVYQYTLGAAWDISTASYASKSFSIATQEGTAQQVNLSADGTTMWILGSAGDDIWQYTLGTAWDVTTAVAVNNFYVGFQDSGPTGMFIDSSAVNRVFMVGSTNDAIYQYNTATNSLEIDTEKLYIDGRLSVNRDFVAGENAYVDGSLTVQGGLSGSTISASSTLTATSTLSLNGSTGGTASFATSVTTANTSINTAQTSGTFTLGGTSGTGTITLGRSTVSQTTDFQAGATASGSTKAINIGTAGLSGSTTTIAIGSAVSGATSTTTLNGLVVNSISAAVSAAGSTQGTATALVANINNVTVVAAAADGVRLPTAVAGMLILVRNSDSADTLKIYPATGGQINALGSNAAYSLTAGSTIELMATTATQWYTF